MKHVGIGDSKPLSPYGVKISIDVCSKSERLVSAQS